MRQRLFGRPLLVSCALHALVLLALTSERRTATRPGAASGLLVSAESPVELAVVAPAPPRTVPPGVLAMVAPGGRSGPHPRHASVVARGAAPSAPPTRAVAAMDDAASETVVDVGAVTAGAETPTPDDAPSPAQNEGEGNGHGLGTGEGEGSGGIAPPHDDTENLGHELHARILGDVSVNLPRDDDRPVLSHDQATVLRLRDVFPRLPESLWPEWRPYIVTLRVCVDEQGLVSDTMLLSAAAPRLDRMVATAARGWRYRPFERAGHATAFCHGVVIKYEHW